MTAAYRDLLLEHVGVTEARADTERRNIWRDALEFALGVVAGPAVDAYPAITPDVWANMHCREGRRCRCVFCDWEERNRPRVVEWERQQQYRPQPAKVFPFGSDADAAEKVATYARDGASAPSYMGPMLSRAHDEAVLGVRSARTHGSSYEAAGLYHAGLRADVHRCYVSALSRDEVRQGARTHDAIRVVMAVQLGHEVPDECAGLAKRGRWAVRVELAARELVPPPPAKAARMCRAVEARREELTRRAHG